MKTFKKGQINWAKGVGKTIKKHAPFILGYWCTIEFFFFFTLMVESENIVSVGFLVEINKVAFIDIW